MADLVVCYFIAACGLRLFVVYGAFVSLLVACRAAAFVCCLLVILLCCWFIAAVRLYARLLLIVLGYVVSLLCYVWYLLC